MNHRLQARRSVWLLLCPLLLLLLKLPLSFSRCNHDRSEPVVVSAAAAPLPVSALSSSLSCMMAFQPAKSAFVLQSRRYARLTSSTLSLKHQQRGEVVNLPVSSLFLVPQTRRQVLPQLSSTNYVNSLCSKNNKPLSSTSCIVLLRSKKSDHVEEATPPSNVVDDNDSLFAFLSTWAVLAALLAQPVVWISLYFVVTTGGGLPAGPFGLLGALEGISYLAVVAIVAVSLCNKLVAVTMKSTTTGSADVSEAVSSLPRKESLVLGAAVQGLSYLTLLLGLLALIAQSSG
jgi:hypothetical protein